MSFNFRQFQKAPKGAGKAKVMSGIALAYEVALATVRLCLAGRWIDRAAAEEVNPILKAKYTKAQSTIPTYFGAGRSGDGVGLWRSGGGAYPPCVENAGLALTRLEQLGHPPAAVAALVGMDEAAMLAAVASLPPFASLPAKPVVASPVAPVASGAATAPTALPSAEEQEAAKKAAREARQKEKDATLAAEIAERCRAEAAAAEAARTPEQNAELDKLLNSCLEDEETEGGDK